MAMVIACVTVNIYFPAGEIQKAAEEIVDEARPQQPARKDSSLHRLPGWLIRWVSFFGPKAAFAQVDVDISTPAIRALRDSIAGRFDSLKGYYSRGALGETNGGYVEIRDQSGLNLKEKAELRKLADAENKDRKALYSEILRANKLEASFLPEVEKIFAKSWRNKVIPGSWVQQDDGKWGRK
jgi:uncharacterized protein YdbL (DUF1318 family)